MMCNDLQRIGRDERSGGFSRTQGGLLRRGLTGVIVIPLLESATLTATIVSDSVWEEMVITDAAFEALGTQVQDIVMHAETRQLTGLLEWQVGIQRKYLNGDWTPTSLGGSDLVLPTQTANGYTPANPFNDRSRLGVRIRLLLQWRAHAAGGGAIGDKAEVSIAAALRGWT